MQIGYQNSKVLVLIALILMATSFQSIAAIFDQIESHSTTLSEHIAEAEDCADHSNEEHAYQCCQMVLLVVDLQTNFQPVNLNELQLAAKVPEFNLQQTAPPLRPPIA